MKKRPKKVYIISQYRGRTAWDVEFHKKVARHFAKQIIYENNVPVAPHLFYTQFLDDNKEAERSIGLTCGLLDLMECDEFFLIIVDGVISDGMKEEIEAVSRMGIQGRIVATNKHDMLETLKVVV